MFDSKVCEKTKYLKTALVLLVDRRYYSLVIGFFFEVLRIL
jgi:hypothetical protein